MKDNDELFTIEINFNIEKKPKEELKGQIKISDIKPDVDLSKVKKYDPEEIINERLKELKEKAEKWRDEKNQAFLNLRDAIFDQNRGAVKSTRSTFLKQAKRYAAETSEPTHFVPFTCYWPTYDVMSETQRKWYFFWRDRARHGEYLKTGLSYLFVYIYEILNDVGVEDECDGFIRLCNVWGEYRTYFPTLDKHLEIWIADYIAIHFKDGLPDFIFNSINYPDIINHLPTNIIIEYVFRTGKLQLGNENAITYISRFSNYKIESSKFYLRSNKNEITESISLAICKLNNYIKEKTGKGIIETYTPSYIKPQKRMPYQNAIYQGDIRSVEVDAFDYTKNKLLRDFFTAVIKQTENILRKMAEYKGKLANSLPDEYSSVIEKFLVDRKNKELIEQRSKIVINPTRIKELIEHSNEIRDRLLEGNEDNENYDDIDDTIEEVNEIQPIKTDEVNESDGLDGYLSEIQRKLVAFIKAKDGRALYNELSESFSGVFVQMEIDNINEAAIEYLGDILILSEGDELLIQEF